MKVRSSISIAAMAIGIVGAGFAAEKADETKLTEFSTQTRVEVSAEGKVIAVQPDPALPAEVGQAIRATVAAWQFAAPLKDGKPVGGVTFVQLGGCAAPSNGGFRLAFDYRSNGPRRDGPVAPLFPPAQARAGQSAKLKLTYRVGTDGVAEVEAVDVVEGQARSGRAFRAVIQEWIDASKFEPEQLAGQSVATRVSFPIDFVAPTKTFHSREAATRDMHTQQQAWAAASTSCKTALGSAAKQDRTVVLDSPFKLLSSG